MSRLCILTVIAAALAAAAGCGSDAEGPVVGPFLEGGAYDPRAGETVRFVDTLRGARTVDVPTGIGQSSLLKLGEIRGIRFEAVLLQFDFDSIEHYAGMTVDSAILDLPVIAVQDTLFHLGVRFHELLGGFTEDDTMTAAPPYDPSPIPGPSGETVRDVNFERTEFALDRSIAQAWLDGTADPWLHGLVIVWDSEPDTLGLIEMNSQNRGTDPPVIRLLLSGGAELVCPVTADYTVTRCRECGFAVVGGVARRIFFEFELSGIPDEAILHYSALVLHVDGGGGLGATGGELLLGISTDFFYYLYAPASGDPSDPGFLSGTGIARDSFVPTLDAPLKVPLGQYMIDLLSGARANTGLVIQSDLETVRVQKAALLTSAAGDSLRPYIEIIYSMPADFGGGR
ncbi:MAG: hypothetical protein PHQ19_10470 [Candidatus Krumholzibacteria bacterium]|nr:hypothetical protein [Candidatus Krumholzibacteria bacterium]